MAAAVIAALDRKFPDDLPFCKVGVLMPDALARGLGDVSRLRRLGGTGAQPALDVLRRLAIVLSVSADRLAPPMNAAACLNVWLHRIRGTC
jgi:hypothetical protein